MTTRKSISDYMSVDEASKRLGITPHRMRSLIRQGDVDSLRMSKRFLLVNSVSLAHYENSKAQAGRPYASLSAFGALWLLSGLEPSWLDYHQRRRCNIALTKLDATQFVQRCRKRADILRLRVPNSYLSDVSTLLKLSGTSAIELYNFDLGKRDDICEGYVDTHVAEKLQKECFATPDIRGNVVLRVVKTLPIVEGITMPEAVVAVDLAESLNSRERNCGLRQLEKMLATYSNEHKHR